MYSCLGDLVVGEFGFSLLVLSFFIVVALNRVCNQTSQFIRGADLVFDNMSL